MASSSSWLELAIDFEIASGIPLPIGILAQRRRGASGVHSLAARGDALAALFRELRRLVGVPLLPPTAQATQCCLAARVHGVPPRPGLGSRPEPLGGAATRTAWRQHLSLSAGADRLLAALSSSAWASRADDWAEKLAPEFTPSTTWSAAFTRGTVLAPPVPVDPAPSSQPLAAADAASSPGGCLDPAPAAAAAGQPLSYLAALLPAVLNLRWMAATICIRNPTWPTSGRLSSSSTSSPSSPSSQRLDPSSLAV